MSAENKQFIREFIAEASGKTKPLEKILQFISESDMELINHVIAFERSFPKYEIIIHDLVAEDDKVAARCTFRLNGSGVDFFGAPTTGKQASIQGFIIYQIHNRKIINHWFLADNLGLMQQLGVIPVNTLEEEKVTASMTHLNVLTSNKRD